MAQKILLKDIAREAGVSKQTVSRVINNNPDVALSTRKKVQAVIDRLGYHPNIIARSLSARQTHTIGLIISNLDHYGPSSMLIEIDRQAYKSGYRLVPYLLHDDDDPSDVENHIRTLLAQRPDAIIWEIARSWRAPVQLSDIDLLSSLPIITMNNNIQGIPNVLNVDEQAAATVLVNHLIAEGYKHIGIVTGPLSWSVSGLRLEGWRQALTKAGLPANPNQIVEGDWTAKSGRRGAAYLLDQVPDLDALFACNDEMALGVLSLLNERGIAVPQEIGVAGYDDMPNSKYFTPPLTTIHLAFDLHSSVLVKAATEMIESKLHTGTFIVPETMTYCPELVIRSSTSRRQT